MLIFLSELCCLTLKVNFVKINRDLFFITSSVLKSLRFLCHSRLGHVVCRTIMLGKLELLRSKVCFGGKWFYTVTASH